MVAKLFGECMMMNSTRITDIVPSDRHDDASLFVD